MTPDDFQRVAAAALSSIDELLAEWFPKGVVEGREFCIGSSSGEAGKSMRICLRGDKAGFWSDFSSDGEAGGDLISLFALIQNTSQGKACVSLAQRLGIALSDDEKYKKRGNFSESKTPPKHAPAQAGEGVEAKKETKSRTEWEPILPVPADSGPYPAAHSVRGRPDRFWKYCDQDGGLLGVVYRFRTSDGGKEILPCVYARHPVSGKSEWRWMQWRDPRPLYLPAPLRDGFPVLVVEGEKCADAAYAAFSDTHDIASWPGGGKAVSKAGWSALAGRDVVLWPDADAKRYKKNHPREGEVMLDHEQPGMKTMRDVEKILIVHDCRILFIDIPLPDEPHHIWELGESEHDGWDIAALMECGATKEEAREWLNRLVPLATDPIEDIQNGDVDEEDVPEWVTANDVPASSNITSLELSAPNKKTTSIPDSASAGKLSRGRIREMMIPTSTGGIKGCRENVYTALKHDQCLTGLVALDQFAMLQVKRKNPPWPSEPGEWNEGDDFHLGMYLSKHYGLVIASIGDIERAVAQAARENGFNPVIDLFEASADAWDGVERVKNAFTLYWGAPASEYMQVVSRMFFVGLAKRAYVPGVKHDDAPVFEGGQGEGKSTALAILGGDWFADTPFRMGEKDGFLAIQGILIYEIAELEQFNRSEVTAVKAFMSSQKDRYREPYGRRMKNQLRRTVFAATTNEGQYFKDMTGNRRFWPVVTGLLDLDGLRRDRLQLIGEAVHLMRDGALWYPTREEQHRLISPVQEDRELSDEWAGAIWEYLEGIDSSGQPFLYDKRTRVTARELLTKALHFEIGKIGQAKTESMRISAIMRKFGWVKDRDSGGARERCYIRPVAVVDPEPKSEKGEEDCDIPF